MRLLILAQAVDLDDPVLGFFDRWLEEFAARYESIEVVCLKEGRHSLPANVHVHSLGKPSFAKASKGTGARLTSRIKYILNFYRYLWKLRGSYDAVFVHMNQEYVLLGGIFWRLFGKKIVLWRNHRKGSLATRIAGMLADTVCYTSPASYVAAFKNSAIMPVGIDTEFFAPQKVNRPESSILFLGRLDPVKRPEIFIDALQQLRDEGVAFTADIVGDPSKGSEDYTHDVRNRAATLALDGSLRFLPGVTQDAARDLFASHAIYVNLTPSGSFDKTIGEAMASGCIVVVSNDAVRLVLGDSLVVSDTQGTARALTIALSMPQGERSEMALRNRAYIEREHSLALLSSKLAALYA